MFLRNRLRKPKVRRVWLGGPQPRTSLFLPIPKQSTFARSFVDSLESETRELAPARQGEANETRAMQEETETYSGKGGKDVHP